MCLQCYVKRNNNLYSNVICDCNCIIKVRQITIQSENYCLDCGHWIV
jgi:hypothetical protein